VPAALPGTRIIPLRLFLTGQAVSVKMQDSLPRQSQGDPPIRPTQNTSESCPDSTRTRIDLCRCPVVLFTPTARIPTINVEHPCVVPQPYPPPD